MFQSPIPKEDQVLVEELYFIHGIAFKALVPEFFKVKTKGYNQQSCREINRSVRLRNRLMKQQQQQRQKVRSY